MFDGNILIRLGGTEQGGFEMPFSCYNVIVATLRGEDGEGLQRYPFFDAFDPSAYSVVSGQALRLLMFDCVKGGEFLLNARLMNYETRGGEFVKVENQITRVDIGVRLVALYLLAERAFETDVGLLLGFSDKGGKDWDLCSKIHVLSHILHYPIECNSIFDYVTNSDVKIPDLKSWIFGLRIVGQEYLEQLVQFGEDAESFSKLFSFVC